jgi:hypothetical protein
MNVADRFTPKPLLDVPQYRNGIRFEIDRDLIGGTKAIFNPDDKVIHISVAMAKFLFSPDTRERSLIRKSLRVVDLTDFKTFCNY